MLITDRGQVVIELQLSAQSPGTLAPKIAAYASSPKIIRALYLVEDPAIGGSLSRAAAGLGLSELIRIQQVRVA